MGIQKNVETVSFSNGNELRIESFPSKIINVKIDVLPLYVVLAAII
ncbi:malate permease, partial [Bacillus wiedmannii]